GTYTGVTAVFEIDDGSSTYRSVQAIQTDTGTIATGVTTTASNSNWFIPTNGCTNFRVRVTAVASGTINVRITPSVSSLQPPSVEPVIAAGDVASGVSDSGNPIKIGGNSSTSQPTAVTATQRVNAWLDTFGRLVIVNEDATNPTTAVFTQTSGST